MFMNKLTFLKVKRNKILAQREKSATFSLEID